MDFSAISLSSVINILFWVASILGCISWLGELAAYRQTVRERYRAVALVNALRKARPVAMGIWAVLACVALVLYPMVTASGILVGCLLFLFGVVFNDPNALLSDLKNWVVLGMVSGVSAMHHVATTQGLPALELSSYAVAAGIVSGFALLRGSHHNGMRGFELYKQG